MSVTHRYRAPSEDGTILAEPPLSRVGEQLRLNRERLENSAVKIDGTPLAEFRQEAIAEIVDLSQRYLTAAGEPVPDYPTGPLLMSGHQPELTHVGVLVKTFALAGLAQRFGYTPLNLIVDNDTTKNTSIRFAVIADHAETRNLQGNRGNLSGLLDPDDISLQAVSYDRYEGEVTYEQRPVLDADLFHSFPNRAVPLARRWGYEPILEPFWDEMLRQYRRTTILGEIVSATRRTWERRWHCHNLEIPLSHLCTSRSFLRFTRHLLADLPRFHTIYNECLAVYRQRHRIRSRNHPAPDLAADSQDLEAPFWRMGRGFSPRSRLMVSPGTIPDLDRIRSRALTTTMFLRVVLSDGFIHGIGGAKYDEVTDAIIERWLGLEPPGFIVITATMHLPLPQFATKQREYEQALHHVRDLDWNPQRYLAHRFQIQPEIAHLLARKNQLITRKPTEKSERKRWYEELRTITLRLREFIEQERTIAESNQTRSQREWRANQLLRRRDFAWCLFPEEVLRSYCHHIMHDY